MGKIGQFEHQKLVMGVLSSDETLCERLNKTLTQSFGPVQEESQHTPFVFTDYYDEEMGQKPVRYFMVFENLVDPSTLAKLKIETNRIEQVFAKKGNRIFNLDPGLLSAGSLILATTKNRSHRIPLIDGIYAETTLIYYGHRFNALPWTYADYKSEVFCTLFKRYRSEYLAQLRLSENL
jgi:hypothetical protein